MKRRKNSSMGKATMLLIFSLGALLTLFLLIVAVCVLSYFTPNPMGLVKPLAIVALIVSAAISGFITAKMTKSAGLCCLSALVVSLIILSGGIILYSGVPSLSVLLNASVYMACMSFCGYLGAKERRVRHRR